MVATSVFLLPHKETDVSAHNDVEESAEERELKDVPSCNLFLRSFFFAPSALSISIMKPSSRSPLPISL